MKNEETTFDEVNEELRDMYKKIYLKKGKEESLKRFHPWVFSGAIQHLPEDVEEG